jgi:beta-phosphoglucomutase-like phosphatase (HAD superfamily)
MIDISCIKYIIFDRDGVLLFSLPVHVKSFQDVLSSIAGLPPLLEVV